MENRLNLSLINLMLIADLALPIGVHVVVIFAALGLRGGDRDRQVNRVLLGSTICLVTLVASGVLRHWMTLNMPAAQFGFYVPVLNLVRTGLMLSGFLIVASTALGRGNMTEKRQTETLAEPPMPETGNPYSHLR